jgi:hypothetical protein
VSSRISPHLKAKIPLAPNRVLTIRTHWRKERFETEIKLRVAGAREDAACEEDYITLSYGALYVQSRAAQGIRPVDMVFPSRAT